MLFVISVLREKKYTQCHLQIRSMTLQREDAINWQEIKAQHNTLKDNHLITHRETCGKQISGSA